MAAATTGPAVRPVVLPRDHGAHPQFTIEWWYTAGTLADRRGRDYFWFATIWSGYGAMIARVNVVDLRADRVVVSHTYTSLSPPNPGQTRLAVGTFRLNRRNNGARRGWSLDAGGLLKLKLSPRQPYVLNGKHGIIQQGSGGPSAYYSDPRLAAQGDLQLNGKTVRVSGRGWLDHQWGNFGNDPGALRWNWFACQFRDGRDLMLYQFLNRHDRPSGRSSTTLVNHGGSVEHPRRFTVTALRPFIRPAGATAVYPLRWRLTVPRGHITITLRARARHQFITNVLVPSFWEGAASITSGAAGGCIVESTREAPASAGP